MKAPQTLIDHWVPRALCAAAVLALAACEKPPTPAATAAAPVEAASAASAVVRAPLPQAGAFVIHGKAPGIKNGSKITLGVTDVQNPTSSKPIILAEAVVKGGAFTLEGNTDAPKPATLILGEHLYAPMVIEKGEFTVTVKGNSSEVRGGDFHDKLFAYTQDPAYIAAVKVSNSGYEAAFKGVNMEDEKQVAKARAKLDLVPMDGERIRSDHLEKIVRSDAPPMLRLLALLELEDETRFPPAERDALYAAFEKELGPQPLIAAARQAVEVRNQIEAGKGQVGVGKPFIDLAFKDAQGKEVKLADVVAKNKLVLLDFWASWCGPCRGEFPHLRKVYGEFHKQGFEIFAVSADEDDAAWRQALKEENVPWINTVDPRGMSSPALLGYGVEGLPSNFLIDSKGTIVGVNMREWDVERAVKAAMAGKPIPQPKGDSKPTAP